MEELHSQHLFLVEIILPIACAIIVITYTYVQVFTVT